MKKLLKFICLRVLSVPFFPGTIGQFLCDMQLKMTDLGAAMSRSVHREMLISLVFLALRDNRNIIREREEKKLPP